MELRASLELKGAHRDAIQVGIFRIFSSVERQKICSSLAETLKMNNIVGSQVFKMNFALKISHGQYLVSLQGVVH